VLTIAVSIVVLRIQRIVGQGGTTAPTAAADAISQQNSGTRPAFVPTPLIAVDDFFLTLQATITPQPGEARPARLEIKDVDIDVPVVTVQVDTNGFIVTPEHFAGYWAQSSPLNEVGNTVIVGHNQPLPRLVFANLDDIELGAEIIVSDQFAEEYFYTVYAIENIQVQDAPESDSQRVRAFVEPTDDRRLTLLTCHPAPDCLSRLIVVARQVDS